MSRVTPVFRPSDYPGTPDERTREELAELFDHMFPGALLSECLGDFLVRTHVPGHYRSTAALVFC